jgi:hypothetical protein
VAPGIRLNEVLPAPEDAFEAEWIEIANDGAAPADLAGWQVDDGEGGAAPYTLSPGTIAESHGLLVVMLPHALLNNDGDTVQILSPSGAVVDAFSYTAGRADLSFCQIDGVWNAGCLPTPGMPNQGASEPMATAPAAAAASDEAPTIEAHILPTQPPPRLDMGAATPYALSTPGILYQGVLQTTPLVEPPPDQTPAAQPPPALVPQPPASTPLPSRHAGLLLLVVGMATAGYERLRPRLPAHPAGAEPEVEPESPAQK